MLGNLAPDGFKNSSNVKLSGSRLGLRNGLLAGHRVTMAVCVFAIVKFFAGVRTTEKLASRIPFETLGIVQAAALWSPYFLFPGAW